MADPLGEGLSSTSSNGATRRSLVMLRHVGARVKGPWPGKIVPRLLTTLKQSWPQGSE
jgi:hypothetical protein